MAPQQVRLYWLGLAGVVKGWFECWVAACGGGVDCVRGGSLTGVVARMASARGGRHAGQRAEPGADAGGLDAAGGVAILR